MHVVQWDGNIVILQCVTDLNREIIWETRNETYAANSYSEDESFVSVTRNFSVTERTTVICIGLGNPFDPQLQDPVMYSITLEPREGLCQFITQYM